ncbi:MAG: hypothetical protein P0107_01205 [Nitrosomonas sp.]|nr:hypothetical protein [Nitrosomonas sp.]
MVSIEAGHDYLLEQPIAHQLTDDFCDAQIAVETCRPVECAGANAQPPDWKLVTCPRLGSGMKTISTAFRPCR